jgi:hypothetical protein
MNASRQLLLVLASFVAMLAGTSVAWAQKAPAATVALDTVKTRIARMERAVATLDAEIAKPAPKGATEAVKTEWENSTAWLRSVRDRYAEHLAALRSAVEAGGDVVATIDYGRTEARVLYGHTLTESAKFGVLSRASKARHAAAMNAISNVR